MDCLDFLRIDFSIMRTGMFFVGGSDHCIIIWGAKQKWERTSVVCKVRTTVDSRVQSLLVKKIIRHNTTSESAQVSVSK